MVPNLLCVRDFVLSSPDHAFVNNERLWIIVEGLKRKTAVCGLYMGFQAPDDRHGAWNDIMYDVLRTELREDIVRSRVS